MNEEKKTTLEDLAKMTQQGFESVETQLGVVERELAEVKSDVKWMKENSSELFTKLDKFIKLYEDQKQELSSLSAQVNRLEKKVAELETKIENG